MEWIAAAVVGLVLLFFAFQIVASIVCIARAAVIAVTGRWTPARTESGMKHDSAGMDTDGFGG